MKKIVLFVLVSMVILASIVSAKQISFNEANIVAENWTVELESKFNDQVRIADGKEIIREGRIVAYVFYFYPKGYVIVSAQDYLPPIKMYSLENDFDTSGQVLEHLIFDNFSTIIDKVNKGELDTKKDFSGKNKRNFAYLLREDLKYDTLDTLKGTTTEEVEPLLSTKWNQGEPYNMYVPGDYTGCVATAFAQIFNYYEWPGRGTGTETYYDPYSKQTLTANFDKEYKWWNMLDDYGYLNDPEENKNAVATLMYDVGVAVHMTYAENGSAANSAKYLYNLVEHLKYSSDIKEAWRVHFPDPDVWFNVAKNQLDNEWVCEYGISGTYGHSVVIDGYRISDGAKTIHINFGWGGTYNGYFSMDNIYISEYLDFYYYTSQTMTTNIYPYPSYKRPVGKAPDSVNVYAYLNKGVFLSEYVVNITWSESPSEDKRLEGYIVYKQKDGSVEEIDRVSPDNKSYEIRLNTLDGYQFSVGVVDKNGAVSEIPPFVTPIIQ